MSHLFNITITTEQGSASGESRANSLQQITNVMPDGVTHYEATLIPLTADGLVVSDEDLMLDLFYYVSNIESASEMTPEKLKEEHDIQLRALQGLTVHIADPTNR